MFIPLKAGMRVEVRVRDRKKAWAQAETGFVALMQLKAVNF